MVSRLDGLDTNMILDNITKTNVVRKELNTRIF